MTKDDVSILRYAVREYIRTTLKENSGDLYREERELMRRALRNLPRLKDCKRGPPLPPDIALQRKEYRLYARGDQ